MIPPIWMPGRDRKSLRHKNSERKGDRRRRLRLEPLEPRHLLAGNGILPSDPLVSLRLAAVDPTTLNPLDEVHPGEEFALAAFVRDLSAEASGVYAFYFDLEYSSNLAEVSGAIKHTGIFVNGASGDTSTPGLIDEVGAFSNQLSPPGTVREQLVALIPFRALQVGGLSFTANAADISPGHDVLLYGNDSVITTNQVKYGKLDLKVTDVSSEIPGIDVLDDEFTIRSGAATTTLNVLANDVSPARPITILSTNVAGISGQVDVVDKKSIHYTPAPGFTGTEVFQYTGVDGLGQTDTGKVTIHVVSDEPVQAKAKVHLSLTDRVGNPVTALTEGEEFVLVVGVEDTREKALGVFAAYLDVQYSSSLVKTNGPLAFDLYGNGTSGNTQIAGLIDEAGGFQSQLTPVGSGAFTLFRLPMVAREEGTAIFQSNPADKLPDHEWLVFNEDGPVDPAAVTHAMIEVPIRSRMAAVDDSFNIAATDPETKLFVLKNDISRAAAPLRITSVDTEGTSGTVTIADEGRAIVYRRAAGFLGSEQFRYIATDGNISDVAEVTVHVQPEASLDDEMSIRLEVTDLQGQPLTQVGVGTEFQVHAFVQDQRQAHTGPRGVFAAYFDLLYDAAAVSPVADPTGAHGIALVFGNDYGNVVSGNARIPGIVDEVGAVQNSLDPLGTQERLLFKANFKANGGRAQPDRFAAVEDTAIELDVLDNDAPNRGQLIFRSDPADKIPGSEILFFDPPRAVELNAVKYGHKSVDIDGGEIVVQSVTRSRFGGTVVIQNNGAGVLYTPASNFFGHDEFTYSIGTGAEAVVHVEVAPVNDAPTAAADAYVAPHSKPLVVSVAEGVLANDRDPDRDRLQARLVTSPEHGRVELDASGSFVYVANEGYLGHDSFTYEAFDGTVASPVATVRIEVAPPPVRLRLTATNAQGEPVEKVRAGDPVVVRAWIQDLRDDSQPSRGVGAAYVDLRYDATTVTPQVDTENRLGFKVAFGPDYQNARTGDIKQPGVVNDVGALQTLLTPLGRREAELFAISFDSTGPRAFPDEFRVSQNSAMNVLNVTQNEQGATWQVEFRATDGGRPPFTDFVLFDPAQAVPATDVLFAPVSVAVQNSSDLVLDSVEPSRAGAKVTVDADGRSIRYVPPQGFTGEDTFVYQVRDGAGRVARGNVKVDVVASWTNELVPLDASGDSLVVPADALLVINDLNRHGPRKLPQLFDGTTFLDVNGDGFVTPLDVLAIINELNRKNQGQAEGEAVLSVEADSVQDEATLHYLAWEAARLGRAAASLSGGGGVDSSEPSELLDDEFYDLLAYDLGRVW